MVHTHDAFGPGSLSPYDDIIDVRSPSEFAQDHIPGAINLPVLDDAERAEIGTLYVRVSRFLARRKGAALVARNIARHLETALENRPDDWQPLVYCWRGGMRSNAMATVLNSVGWYSRTVTGGYKAWRRHVLTTLHDSPPPLRLVMLDGNTGTAKTDILNRLPAHGVQVIDLEGMAAHRGSVFGLRAGDTQPSQKLFESRLAFAVDNLDLARPIVVEAESSRIGQRIIPPGLWTPMTHAPAIEIAASLPVRARYLAQAYADITEDAAALTATLERLRPLHPRERLAEWLELAKAGDHVALAHTLMEHHYDASYTRQRERHGRNILQRIDLPNLTEADRAAAAALIAEAVSALP